MKSLKRGSFYFAKSLNVQGQFNWIVVYHCHLTKFVILRLMSSKRAAEVAFQLLDIFLIFGAPAILQSDNGSEFTAQVITELNLFSNRRTSLIMLALTEPPTKPCLDRTLHSKKHRVKTTYNGCINYNTN